MDAADLRSAVAEKLGLKLETHKLLFRGKEKEDDEFLEPAGVKENSKVLLVEDTPCEPEIHEEVKETSVPSKGGEAVAQVKKEVDKLAEQVDVYFLGSLSLLFVLFDLFGLFTQHFDDV